MLSDGGLPTEEGLAQGTVDGSLEFYQLSPISKADGVADRGTPR